MMDEIREIERQYWQAIERWNEARQSHAAYSSLNEAARSVAYWRDAWVKAVARADRISYSEARRRMERM